MYAIVFEERCAMDDHYGRVHPVRLFPEYAQAEDWLESIGYQKKEHRNGRQWVHYQYHSEMVATIHDVEE